MTICEECALDIVVRPLIREPRARGYCDNCGRRIDEAQKPRAQTTNRSHPVTK